MKIFNDFKKFFSPEEDPDLSQAFSRHKDTLPVLWLLGKTGSGKSSLIQAVTGDTRVEIGNGFSPCTRSACSYDFPQDRPLMRFLDTRGLGEPGYDPQEDMQACQDRSHMLILVMKTEEPEQSHVLNALSRIRKSGRLEHILLVHTGVYLVDDKHDRFRCLTRNQEQVENVWGGKIDSVQVDFELDDGSSFGVDQLARKLSDTMPIISEFMDNLDHADQEKRNFNLLKKDILWHAGIAGASDAVPLTGSVTVPAIQARMVYFIAGKYQVEWDKKSMAEFAGALGASFGAQYAARLGIRQMVKLIPVYGQTVGSASAAVISFSTTFALGRAACKYIYHKSRGEAVSREELRKMYQKAFNDISKVARHETGSR